MCHEWKVNLRHFLRARCRYGAGVAAPRTIFSWNLAMLERSAEAPHTWGLEHTEQAVRESVVAVDADIVLFQELPAMVPFLPSHDMVRANPQSHQGHLATLFHRDRVQPAPEPTVVPGCGLLVTLPDGLTIANVHLQAGKAAIGERLEQLATVIEASPTPDILVMGDTNTRLAEADALANAGLTGRLPPRPTWDGKRNRFHRDIPEFSAYFTRWFGTERVKVSNVAVWSEPHEVEGHAFNLSDHYGLSLSVELR
ncbi:MAG: hypothetical protein ACI8TP_003728 [Acidimicrobiales bacterium]